MDRSGWPWQHPCQGALSRGGVLACLGKFATAGCQTSLRMLPAEVPRAAAIGGSLADPVPVLRSVQVSNIETHAGRFVGNLALPVGVVDGDVVFEHRLLVLDGIGAVAFETVGRCHGALG